MKGCSHRFEHLPAIGGDDLGDVVFQRVAKGVVGHQQGPALAALLCHGLARAACNGCGVGVVVHPVRRAVGTGDA
ncbi:hypothetical protein D3C72_1358520 [compost metagenome]